MPTRNASPLPSPALAALLGSVAVTGCLPHVQIDPAPPRNAPWAERRAAFQRLRPAGLTYSWQGVVAGGALLTRGAPSQLQYDDLLLPDGTAVRAPEDLLPALDADSAGAELIRTAESLRTTADAIEYGGGVVFLAGAAALPFSALVDGGAYPSVVASVMGFGALAAVVGASWFRGPSRRARVEAFRRYEPSLRTRLGICEGPGRAPVDCDGGGPADGPWMAPRRPLHERTLPDDGSTE